MGRIAGVRAPEKRRTQPLPSILSTYSPRTDALPKPTPMNLRRFAGRVPIELYGETPFPRIGEPPYLLTFAPHGFYWFRLVQP